MTSNSSKRAFITELFDRESTPEKGRTILIKSLYQLTTFQKMKLPARRSYNIFLPFLSYLDKIKINDELLL